MSSRSFWWFAEFQLTRRGIFVRKNGRKIGGAVLTPVEALKWASYYCLVRIVAALRRLAYPRSPRIWFAPDCPRPWYVVWAAASWAGFRFARSEAEADLHFYFDDSTWGAPFDSSLYVNGSCTDISKSRVARVFGETAGYPLKLDPTTHHGPAVEKGEINGAHDGRIVQCPRPSSPGKCYERVVDATHDGIATDLRTSIVGGRAVAIVRKTKPAAKRFSIHNSTVQYLGVEEAFTPDELSLIEKFCTGMQLQWGALDVLRDNADGRIYIVDVNKTDTGPAVDLTWRDRIKLTRTLADALAASCQMSIEPAQVTPSCVLMTPSMAVARLSRPVSNASE